MQLTKAEEQVMKYIWNLENAYLKDILNEYPEPKPATTTVATLLRRMIDKGAIGYTQYGKVREYYPIILKSVYFTSHIKGIIKEFFNDSTSQFASFFTKESDLSKKELEELRDVLDQQIKDKED